MTKVFNININVSFQLCPVLLNVQYTVPNAVDRSESFTVFWFMALCVFVYENVLVLLLIEGSICCKVPM